MRTLPASVLVVENHPVMREALCVVIRDQPDMELAGEATNSVEALRMAPVLQPDLILYSIGNPGWDDLMTVKVLRDTLEDTPILALARMEIQGQKEAALVSGARAVMTKPVPRIHLIKTLRDLLETRRRARFSFSNQHHGK